MSDLIDAISARIKAPYFGYVLLAFIGLNWRGFFLLAVMVGTPQERLEAFDAQTSVWSLLIFPLIIGALVTLVSPWVSFLFNFLSKRPFEYIDNIYLDFDHLKIIRKTQLEQSRAELFANKESELIERAKRDEEILEIGNEELKEKLKQEIDELRRERVKMSRGFDNEPNPMGLSIIEQEIIKAAAQDQTGSIMRAQYLEGRSIQIGSRVFGGGSVRDFSKYDFALKSLVSKGLVAKVGSKGEMFELTHSGWEIADTL